jgi:hydrogenase maturation protease
MAAERRLIVGIGNPDRGDDAVGHEAIRILEGRTPEGIVLVRQAGEATALVDCLRGEDTVYLIDAAASGSAPGTVCRFDAGARPLPAGLTETSSHGFGLAQAIELARTLGTLPRHCIVYAIEGAQFAAGAPLTPPVARAAEVVAERILSEITSQRGDLGDRAVHEASLMAGIMSRIEAVAEAESASRVVGIKVWCGALSHMSREHFKEHFDRAAAGTLAEGAALDVTVSSDPGDPRAQEVVLESVEIET